MPVVHIFLCVSLNEEGFIEFNTHRTSVQQKSIFVSNRFSVNGGENRDKVEQERQKKLLRTRQNVILSSDSLRSKRI